MSSVAHAPANANPDLIELSTEIVAAYVSHNAISPTDLGKLISDVHSALRGLSTGGDAVEEQVKKPAVTVRRSVTQEYIVCLEDGRKFKSLKRHLRTAFGLTPDEYRKKWGLPADYPMVAPSYAETRSRLAKTNGLGRKAG